MMNVRKTETSSTVYWQRQIRQMRGENQLLAPADKDAEPLPLDLNQLLLMPFVMMAQRIQGRMTRELDMFSGICTGQARAFDDVYLGRVQRFQDTVSGKHEEIRSEFQSKL